MDKNNPNFSNLLFPFLKNINTRKWRDLEYFIRMPSNPSSEEEIEVAEYILENARYRKANEEEEIIERFFSFSENPKKAWQKVKHRIQQTFLRYYALRKLEQHPMEGIFLAEIYNEYELKNKKKSEIKRQKKKLKDLLDPNKALYEYWLLEMEVDEQREQRESDADLDIMEQKLDEFYLEKKFRCLFERVNRPDIINDPSSKLNEEVDLVFLKWAKKKIESSDSIKATIYYELYTLLKSESDIDKAKVIDELIEHNYENIDTETLQEFYKCLLNYYIKRVNLGEERYAKNYLDCLSMLLERGLIYRDKELSLQDFKNSIGIALIHNDTERAWKLLKHHEERPSYLEGEGKYVFNFMHATILLCEGNYAESSDVMMPYKLKDYYHDLDSQFLKLQLNYSLRQDKSSILRNLEMIKKRTQAHKKISIKKKKLYLAFLEAL